MAVSGRSAAHEFGEALKSARQASGVTLEAIAERTKIALRVLDALEHGDLRKLPDRVFGRLFLRQYLEIVGAPRPEQFMSAFEAAWRELAGGAENALPPREEPLHQKVALLWLLALAVVAGGVVAVIVLGARYHGARPVAAPVPVVTPMAAVPAVTPAPESPKAEPPARANLLVLRTGTAPCWAEVILAGGHAQSRLLAAGSRWEIETGGQELTLVLGDAGAASIEYQGETRSPAGRSGEVARLHFVGQPGPETAPR
jgi:transcriptional regulator with XRE-family HTH domain